MNIFNTIQQGDSATWADEARTLNGIRYGSASHTLKYELRGPGAPLTLTASANGSGWTTTLTTGDSATLSAGKWWWSAILTATGERVTIGSGELTVTQDLGAITAPNFDGRSLAETALADAEAALASFSSSKGKIKKYTIGQRSMEFATIAEILPVVSYWKARVMTEQTPKMLAQGLGDPRRLFVRFTR